VLPAGEPHLTTSRPSIVSIGDGFELGGTNQAAMRIGPHLEQQQRQRQQRQTCPTLRAREERETDEDELWQSGRPDC
jgi:hypothetical protein